MENGNGERPKIVVLDDWENALHDLVDWQTLRRHADVDIHRQALRGVQLEQAVADASVLVLLRERTPVDAQLIAAMPRLKRIVCTGARNRTLDAQAAQAAGITIVHTRGGPSKASTCELTWALILAAKQRLMDVALRTDRRQWRPAQTWLAPTLAGKCLGVIGLGDIGQRVAAVGRAFGMDVVAWSPHMTAERAAAHGATSVPLPELLQTCDVVSLHLVPSPPTRGLLDAQKLALMPPHSILVNTSRAELIDTPALVHALQSGRPGFCALDVYDDEPLPQDHPLLSLPNVLLTPHLGFVCREVMTAFAEDVQRHLVEYLGLPAD